MLLDTPIHLDFENVPFELSLRLSLRLRACSRILPFGSRRLCHETWHG